MTRHLVLIHGFLSSSDTWDALAQKLCEHPTLREFQVHRFGYESPKVRRPLSRSRIPGFNDIARSLGPFLWANTGDSDPVVFVTHSQGGLVLQRYFAWMLNEGRGHELARIRAAILLACPNNGSNYLASLRFLSGFNTRPQARELAVLNEVVTETQKIVLARVVPPGPASAHSCHIPMFVYAGRTDNIVSLASATSVFPDAAVLPGDHSGIINPDAPHSLTLPTIIRHVSSAFPEMTTAGTGSVPSGESDIDQLGDAMPNGKPGPENYNSSSPVGRPFATEVLGDEGGRRPGRHVKQKFDMAAYLEDTPAVPLESVRWALQAMNETQGSAEAVLLIDPIEKGLEEPRRFALSKASVTIGRGEGADVVLHNPRASRRHCRIEADASGHRRIFDTGSANGTLIGRDVLYVGEGRELHHGDRIGIADAYVITYLLAGPLEK